MTSHFSYNDRRMTSCLAQHVKVSLTAGLILLSLAKAQAEPVPQAPAAAQQTATVEQPGVAAPLAPAKPIVLPDHMTSTRCMMPAVVMGTDIYVCGGQSDAKFLKDVERINTLDGTITVLTPPIIERSRHVAEVAGQYIYLIGGYRIDDEISFTNIVERYDPRTGEVKRMADLPIGDRMAGAAVVGDKIYVLGGGDENNNHLRSLQIYDIAKDEWTLGTPMPIAKEGDMVEYKGKLYSVGGYDGTTALKDFEAYDIATDTWQKLPDLPIITSAQYMTVNGDMLYLFGDYASMDRVWGYSFATGEWRTLTNLTYTPRRHTAVVTCGDSVVVMGGTTGTAGPVLDTIQSYTTAQLQDAYAKGNVPTL